MKIFGNTFSVGWITRREKNKRSGLLDCVSMAVPSRLSSFNGLQIAEKESGPRHQLVWYIVERALEASIGFCFQGRWRVRMRDRSTVCLSGVGNTGPSQCGGLSCSLSTDLKQPVNLTEV